MEKLTVMNTRELKVVDKHLQEQFGIKLDLKGAFFKNPKEKIYYSTKDVGKIDWKQLRINSIGMYFADVREGVRLSIEGAQLLGPKAKKGVLELSDEEAYEWMQGLELQKDIEPKGFLLIKHKNDFLGCGKAVAGRVMNYVPKNRRVLVK